MKQQQASTLTKVLSMIMIVEKTIACLETIYSNLLYFSSLLPSFGNHNKRDTNNSGEDGSLHMRNTSLWLVHISHGKANQVGSLGIDPVAVDRPGGIGDAGSLRIVHICFIGVW